MMKSNTLITSIVLIGTFFFCSTINSQQTIAEWYLNDNGLGGVQSSLSFATGSQSLATGANNTSSGIHSTALGTGVLAFGDASLATGSLTLASGYGSTAMGIQTTAAGYGSTAIGHKSIASGLYSTAIGFGVDEEYDPTLGGTPYYKNETLGNYSVVLGSRNKSVGINSISIGRDNLSAGGSSYAIGENNIATGNYSMAIGLFSESPSVQGFAFGNNAYADGFNTVAIGSANTIDENADSQQWNVNNRAFVVGNGYYDSALGTITRSDAFTIRFNGDATLSGNLAINSDARLKANIISLGSTLAKLLQIDGKTYTMKRDDNQKQQIGVLAQDIEKVFPELVSESNGVKSVNYQGLVPVLINAMKEQQKEIEELKNLVKEVLESK
jgi:hypothetical protein